MTSHQYYLLTQESQVSYDLSLLLWFVLLLTGGAVYSPALTDFTFMVKVRASPLLSVVFLWLKWELLNFFMLFPG